MVSLHFNNNHQLDCFAPARNDGLGCARNDGVGCDRDDVKVSGSPSRSSNSEACPPTLLRNFGATNITLRVTFGGR